MGSSNNYSDLTEPPRQIAGSKIRRETVTTSKMHLARIFILLWIFTAPVWAQGTKRVPAQGNPPRHLTRLPDGHWTANRPLVKNPDYEVYVVKRGDTLWDLSRQFLQNPYLWPQIWEMNPHIINPHWIYPKDELLIKAVKVIPAPPGPASAPSGTPSSSAPAGESAATAPTAAQPPTSAGAPSASPAEAESAAGAAEGGAASLKPINLISNNDVYCAGYFSSKQIGKEMVIMGTEEGEHMTYFADRNIVYVNKGKNWDMKPGDQYFVIRPIWKFTDFGPEFKEAENRNKYGYYYRDMGRIRILLVNDHSSVAEVVAACEEMIAGDLLIPFSPRTIPTLTALRPLDRMAPYNDKGKGKIILTKDCLTNVGKGNIVYIDMGKKKNVAVGDIFRIYRQFSGDNVSTFNRPVYQQNKKPFKEIRKVLGELIVLRAEDNTATALIISSREEIHSGDAVEQE